MRDILTIRFLRNRDRSRLFRVSVRSTRTGETATFEGYPSTKGENDPELSFRIPGVPTIGLPWDDIVSLEEVDNENLDERTTDPNLPF